MTVLNLRALPCLIELTLTLYEKEIKLLVPSRQVLPKLSLSEAGNLSMHKAI